MGACPAFSKANLSSLFFGNFLKQAAGARDTISKVAARPPAYRSHAYVFPCLDLWDLVAYLGTPRDWLISPSSLYAHSIRSSLSLADLTTVSFMPPRSAGLLNVNKNTSCREHVLHSSRNHAPRGCTQRPLLPFTTRTEIPFHLSCSYPWRSTFESSSSSLCCWGGEQLTTRLLGFCTGRSSLPISVTSSEHCSSRSLRYTSTSGTTAPVGSYRPRLAR